MVREACEKFHLLGESCRVVSFKGESTIVDRGSMEFDDMRQGLPLRDNLQRRNQTSLRELALCHLYGILIIHGSVLKH